MTYDEDRAQRMKLRQILNQCFNESELRALCFELDVDYEEVKGENKSDTVMKLIGYFWRRDRVFELMAFVKQARPSLQWDSPCTGLQKMPRSTPSAPTGVPRCFIQILLSGSLAPEDREKMQEAVMEAVVKKCEMLSPDPAPVQILWVLPGSIKMTGEIPEEWLGRIALLTPLLESLGIKVTMRSGGVSIDCQQEHVLRDFYKYKLKNVVEKASELMRAYEERRSLTGDMAEQSFCARQVSYLRQLIAESQMRLSDVDRTDGILIDSPAQLKRMQELGSMSLEGEVAARFQETFETEDSWRGGLLPLMETLSTYSVQGRPVQRPYIWPQLWQSGIEKNETIATALDSLGWRDNPFGPEKAEGDPRLPSYYVEPPGWSSLLQTEPTLLFVSPGCGQTATLRLLMECLRSGQAWRLQGSSSDAIQRFPIYVDANMASKTGMSGNHLQWLSRVIATGLLDFLALNPHTFAASSSTSQLAISQLVGGCFGSPESISQYLMTAGLEYPAVASSLAEMLADTGGGRLLQRGTLSNFTRIMAEARVADFSGYVIAVDFSSQYLASGSVSVFPNQIQPLVDLMPDLAGAGSVLRIGMPLDVGRHLEIPSGLHSFLLGNWSEDLLMQMLQMRVDWATGPGGGSLTQLFGPDRPRNVTHEIVSAANGSPRQLVRLGNALLSCYGEKRAKLTTRDLEEIINRSTKPLSAWRTELRQKLMKGFDDNDLKNLCVDLGIDYDSLPAHGKDAKARELVTKLERLGRLPDLTTLCKQLRPDISWDLPLASLEPLC